MTIFSNKTIINSANCSFFTTKATVPIENNKETDQLNTLYTEPGNIVPHFWFSKIVDKRGRADSIAIILFSEVFALCRFTNSSTDCSYITKSYSSEVNLIEKTLRTSYEYFSKKFYISEDQIRRGFIRLENLGLLKRGFCNIPLEEGGWRNKLLLTIDNNFFNSCFRDPEQDIRVSKKVKNPCNPYIEKGNKEKNLNDANIQSLEISYHHISNKNNDLKNRSMESNFYQNSFKEKERKEGEEKSKLGKYLQREEKKTIGLILKSYLFAKPKKLEEFYPLTKEDGDQLKSNSRREFSLNAMNEILLSLTKKLPNHTFPNKSAFMSYMSKTLTYEIREEAKINNETFKIKINMRDEDYEMIKQEKYLSQIENSLEVGPEWHLRKKIAAVFERKKAYEILTSLKWMKRTSVEEGKEDSLILVFNKEIELSLMDKEILLSQVKATHDGVGNSERRIGRIEFQGPKKETINKSTKNEFISETEQQDMEQQSLGQQGTWYQIRKEIKKYIGEDGEAIDKSWFSKLKVEEDKQTKSLTLQAPSEFVKDWVEQNYNWLIEKSCTQFNYKHSFA